MKHSLSHLLLLSIVFVLLTSCGGTPAITGQVPAATDELLAVATELPAPPAVILYDTTALAPMPADKIVSFGTNVPNGIASNTGDGIGVTFYATDGLVLGELRTPALAAGSPEITHIAGSYTGALDFPLVYYFTENGLGSLCVNQNGQTTTQVDVRDLIGMTGVPGQPILAYAILQPQTEGVLRTEVYLGDLANVPFAWPVLIYNSTESRTVIPVMIRAVDGVALGLWYTLRPWGIGGEIVFKPNEGLYYLALQDQAVYEVLPREAAFSALAQDQIWVAFWDKQGDGSGLTLRNISTGQELILTRLPDSDHGAGDAVFSTSNAVAWLEARGSLYDDTFSTTVRVANEEGTFQQDYPQSMFYKSAGLGDQVFVRPVGWLDEQTFLVQVKAREKGGASTVVRVNIGSGEISALAPGIFVGFLHHP